MTAATDHLQLAVAHIDVQIGEMNATIDDLRTGVDTLVDARVELVKICASLESVATVVHEVTEDEPAEAPEPAPRRFDPEPEPDDVVPQGPQFECEHCEKRFWKRSGLAIHVGRMHLGQSVESAPSPAPVVELHESKKPTVTGKAFACSSCPHRTVAIRDIIRHTRAHHGRDTYASERMPVSA